MNKTQKGTFGYLKKQQKIEIAKTIVLFAISFAIYITGYITTKSIQNYFTIIAVLGVLPASKSLVSAIMFVKAKGCSSFLYFKIQELQMPFLMLTDLYFTTYNKNFQISHMIVYQSQIIGLTETSMCDIAACEDHISDILSKDGRKSYSVKIMNHQEQYLKRLSVLISQRKEQKSTFTAGANDEQIRKLLVAVSL